jgi:hypothetical protein
MADPGDPTNSSRGVQQFGYVSPADVIGASAVAPLPARLKARLLAGRYDRMLADGAVPRPNSPLDVHARRLTTVAEREAVARWFRRSLREARKPLSPWTARSWLYRPNVVAAADLIDTVTMWLHSPRSVSARGMAQLRLLLSDGTGPVYMSGRGDLIGPLHAALAVL